MKVITVTSEGGMNQFHRNLQKHINEGSISLKIIVMNIVIYNFTVKSLHPVLFTFHTVFQLF